MPVSVISVVPLSTKPSNTKEARDKAKKIIKVPETTPQVSYCRKYGIELRRDASFCHKCGTSVSEDDNYIKALDS